MTDLTHAQPPPANIATSHALHEAGRLKEAELMYQHVLEQDPTHADTWHFLGILAWQGGNSALAQERISHAICIRPTAAMYANLGSIMASSGAIDAAIARYQSALALDQELPACHPLQVKVLARNALSHLSTLSPYLLREVSTFLLYNPIVGTNSLPTLDHLRLTLAMRLMQILHLLLKRQH